MSTTKKRLTKRAVDALVAIDKPISAWDTEIAGFHVEARPTGKKAFLFFYRVGGGRGARQRRSKIGDFGSMTVEQARGIAREWAAAVAKGEDPAGARQEARNAPTMADLFERYLSEHARVRNKASSAQESEDLIRLFLRPAFGTMKVRDISKSDVMSWHAGMKDRPIRANRALATLSKAMALAEDWRFRGENTNPCRGVPKYVEHPRQRYLSAAELQKLGKALSQAETGELGAILPQAVAAIRLLLLTGMRRGEVLSLQWRWVDTRAGRIDLPDSKSGPKSIPISDAAITVLEGLPRYNDNPHVIPGGKPGAPLVNLKDPWSVIRRSAGLEDVRLHDLRHTFASTGAGAGKSLHMIGGLLGHKQSQTTQRYAHLQDHPLRAASSDIARLIDQHLSAHERNDDPA